MTKSKKFDIKFLFIKEIIQSGQISIEHLRINSMIIDPPFNKEPSNQYISWAHYSHRFNTTWGFFGLVGVCYCCSVCSMFRTMYAYTYAWILFILFFFIINEVLNPVFYTLYNNFMFNDLTRVKRIHLKIDMYRSPLCDATHFMINLCHLIVLIRVIIE